MLCDRYVNRRPKECSAHKKRNNLNKNHMLLPGYWIDEILTHNACIVVLLKFSGLVFPHVPCQELTNRYKVQTIVVAAAES